MKMEFKNKIALINMIIGLCIISQQGYASDFNIPFINAAGLGSVYADWATAASDASTTYTNPAGLVNLTHQQLVFAPLVLFGNTKFTGTALTPPYPFPISVTQTGSSSSQLKAFMPSLYYSTPTYSRLGQIVFGFGVNAPFALSTSYSKQSIVRYLSTRSQVVDFDIGPSIGFKLSDTISAGLGVDVNYLAFTLENMYGPPVSIPGDSESHNNLAGWGLGWHAGLLYQSIPSETRIGMSFNSTVMVHTSGDSTVYTPFPPGRVKVNNQKANMMLPARFQVSVQQDLSCQWTAMATVFYTGWHTLDKITMKRVVLPDGNTTSVSIPFEYHDTLDYSAAIAFKPSHEWILKAGLRFMTTPSNKRDHGVADPVGSATIVGIGAHYQQNACLDYDIGYEHAFFKDVPINVASPLTSLVGHNAIQANVLGVQVNWSIGKSMV